MPGFRRSTFGPYPGFDVGDLSRRRYGDLLARKAGLWPGDRALDVECGHGTVAIALALAFTKGRVVGVDRSGEMLARARKNAEAEGLLKRLDLVRADPSRLPFKPEVFAVTTMALALREVKDKAGAIGEFHRVTWFYGKLFLVDLDFSNSRSPPSRAKAVVLDERLLDLARETGWGKLAVQRIDVLRDGTRLNVLQAKRFDLDGEEEEEDEEEDEIEDEDEE